MNEVAQVQSQLILDGSFWNLFVNKMFCLLKFESNCALCFGIRVCCKFDSLVLSENDAQCFVLFKFVHFSEFKFFPAFHTFT